MEATSLATGCVDTEIVTINDVIVIPTVTANVTNQLTQCSPFNGAVSASAGAGIFYLLLVQWKYWNTGHNTGKF